MPALIATPAQRAELRARAHALNPVVIIGGDGLTDAVLAEIERGLAAHQLIKIRVFGDERDARIAVYEEICARLNAAPIQHIGKLLVIWRPAPAVRKRSGLPSAAEAYAGKATRNATNNGLAGRRRPAAAASAPAGRRPSAAQREQDDPTQERSAPPRAQPKGAGPRVVKVVKSNPNSMRRVKPEKVLVLGNERVTAGGSIKRTKKRQTSAKRQHQTVK